MENILNFRKIDGTPILNVEEYVKNWAKENPYGKIIIGCDSQMHGRRIKYSIAVVMRYLDKYGTGKGAHVIVADTWEKRTPGKSQLQEMPVKLWKEAEYLLLAAQMVDGSDDTFKKKLTLHLDFNSIESEKSNILFASGIGYLVGLGYAAEGKPNAYVATHTADAFCR